MLRSKSIGSQRGFLNLRTGKRRGGRSAGGGGGGGGGVPDLSRMSVVVNMQGLTDYGPPYAAINVIKQGDSIARPWFGLTVPGAGENGALLDSDGRLDANGEPAANPVGQTVERLVWIDLSRTGYEFQTLKTGTYVLKWAGAGVITLNGITPATTAANRVTFSISGNFPPNLWIRVNGPATAISIVHVDHEAAMDAGELLNPDFVTWLQSWPNVHAFRCMNWEQCNYGNVIDANHLPAITNISWARDNTNLSGCPPELIAEVGIKTGRPVWITRHRAMTDAAWTAKLTRIRDRNPAATFKVFIEGTPNESWNFGTFPAGSYLVNTYAQTIQVRDASGNPITWAAASDSQRLNSAYGHMSIRSWVIARQVFGADRVIPVGSFQTDFPGLMDDWPTYFDPALAGGATVASFINGVGGAKGIIAPTNYWARSDAGTYKQRSIANIGAQTDQQWVDGWKASVDQVKAWLITHRTTMTARGIDPTVPMVSYEGSPHDFARRNNGLLGSGEWADFQGTVNTGNNTIEFSAGDYANWTNGDRMNAPNGSALATGVHFNEAGWVRRTGTNALRVYGSQAAYDADSANTGAGALTLNAGSWMVANATRHILHGAKIYSLMQGARGQEIYSYVADAWQDPAVNGKGISIFSSPALTRDWTHPAQSDTPCFDMANRGIYNVGNETAAVAYLKGLGGATVTSVTSASATEGGGIVHTVTLSAATAASQQFSFSISAGSATSGTDYNATPTFSAGVTLAAGTLTVPVGVSSFTVTVAASADTLKEPWEQYTITVGGVSNTGTVIDEDTLIAWDASATATHYLLRWGTTAGGPYPNEMNVGNVLSIPLHTVTPALAVGTNYYFVAYAVNGSGTSPASNQIQVFNGAVV